MSNKTIDGVSRELAEDAAEAFAAIGMFERLQELRALLDAPVPVPTPAAWMRFDQDQKAIFTRGKRSNDSEPLYLHPTAYRVPAAQPQGEPVAWRVTGRGGLTVTPQYPKWAVGERGLTITPLYAEQPAPVAVDAVIHGGKLDEYDAVLGALDPESVCPYLSNGEAAELVAAVRTLQVRQITQPVPVAQKYDDVLLPFLGMMRKELHANSGKGDRDGWLGMTSGSALEEINHHRDKLWYAVATSNPEAIREHAADVANCAMMVADVCGVLK